MGNMVLGEFSEPFQNVPPRQHRLTVSLISFKLETTFKQSILLLQVNLCSQF